MKNKTQIKPSPTLKQVNASLRRIDREISATEKLGEKARPYLKVLQATKEGIIEAIKYKTDPNNVIRTTLSKKKQRLAGYYVGCHISKLGQ